MVPVADSPASFQPLKAQIAIGFLGLAAALAAGTS